MSRLLLALTTALTLAGFAGAAQAGAPATVDDKHLCVITNSEKHEGYCLKLYGVPELPGRP